MSLFNLLPKEEKFYDMIGDLNGHAHESARQLALLVHASNDAQRKEAAQRIRDSKDNAKKVKTLMVREVCQTFITPFDREDMQELAEAFYNIPKLIDKTQDRMMRHDLEAVDDDFNQFADVISRQADIMEEIIQMIQKSPKLHKMNDKVRDIHELEDKGDNLLGDMLEQAFQVRVSTPAGLILRKDVYEMLEDVTDFYRDIANIALRIVLKHS